MEAVLEAGGDLNDAAKATDEWGGLGRLFVRWRRSSGHPGRAGILISSAAVEDQDPEHMVNVAGSAVEAAIEQASETNVAAEHLIGAAATGVVEAAYEVGKSHGDQVRQSVLTRIRAVRGGCHASPE